MKTITEFTAATLKNASQTQQELQTAGKTAEELPQAMGEALKLEGDKLNFLMNALSALEGAKKNLDLKRVVVLSLNEGEKAPAQAVQKGDQYYLVEFYAPLASQKPAQKADAHEGKGRRGKRDRDGKRGDKKGGKGRRDDARGPRPPRGPRPEAAAKAAPAEGGALPKIRPVAKTETAPASGQ